MVDELATSNDLRPENPPQQRVQWYAKGGKGFQAAALLLILVSLPACFILIACLSRPNSGGGAETPKDAPDRLAKYHLFHDWPKDRKPDLVLILTGERHGYVLPCGCSSPQIGGVERLYNFVQLLKDERGWPVTALDLGDTPQKEGPAGLPNIQGVLKYDYTMRAMDKIGFQATSFGEYEGAQPLTTAIDQLFQDPKRKLPAVLACNLQGRKKNFVLPDGTEMIGESKVIEVKGSKLKVGVIGAIGVDVADAISKNAGLEFDDLRTSLPATLGRMAAAKPDLRVLLYHGNPSQAAILAERIKDFDVIVSMSEMDEPPAKTEQAGNTTIVPGLGHKGKNIGVLGVYRTGNAKKPFEMHYQLVRLGEEYLTSKDEEKSHPITKLMEEYTKELKVGDYLHKYPNNRPIWAEFKGLEAKYVGSDACQKCHEHAYQIWEHSNHAHAYQTLVDAKRPANRQFDGECIVCHTVGFTQRTGFVDLDKTSRLINVGCESCHGPGSAHIAKKKDAAIHDLMNPYKAKPDASDAAKKQLRLHLNDFCRKCHDDENDVNWDFEKRWPQVEHMTPKKKADD